MSDPVISVVMPVYNGEKYLKEAIDSILNQTFTDFEFLIINDGSTDKSEEIILSYDDPRIRYVKNETNLKIVKALNKGIELARGEYIARMDADDISFPERFEKQILFMKEHPEVDVCGTWFKTLGEKEYIQTLPLEHDQIKSDLLYYTPIAHPTVMIKKSIFEQYAYSDNFPKAEDYALWIELSNDFQFANMQEALVRYRIHKDQTSAGYSNIQEQSRLKALLLLLKEFDSNISQASAALHKQLVLHETISLDKTEKWLNFLIRQNQKVHFFEPESLKKSLFNIWEIQAFAQTVNGLSTLMKFYSSSLYLSGQLTLSMHCKFIIKCIIRYSRKRQAVYDV